MTKLLPVVVAGLLASLAPCRLAANPGGNATAYDALRLVGKTLGAESLHGVVEVTGRGGAPQPAQWRIVVCEMDNNGREIKVIGGRIVSQETVHLSSPARPINLQDLNLDSSGAFEAADTQARKTHVRFDSINYSLRVGAATGKPVWDLELINQGGAHVGGMRLAAHDGNTLSMNGLVAGQPAPLPNTTPVVVAGADHDTIRPVRVPSSRQTTTTTTVATVQTTAPTLHETEVRQEEPRPDEGGFFARVGQTLDHTTRAVGDTLGRAGDSVNHGARRTGATVQRFFTGHSDLDQ